ncbi:TauD/TfdA family dioxygenase [Mycobacterium sp. CVI_P3]|uniref:TauD/TfdA family dioxygenase n=1 Tax=Mycobacterium pinniadriaticum TaxID=2994102 RepID=A0ABT3S8T1_9MYCO|nr:TauD/TfdA family dioxygenase [Mycobacterium pinniadriaticum]MCX2929348.1 TauD/TfdA family dioxygenase [Mycobacterium pinniadriaticum]MCX2935772.1 TauD/TfdA family dioxygenase [Mycobacterium pinniadriaticum]
MSSAHFRPLREDLSFGARVSGVTHAALEDEHLRDRLRRVFDERGMILFEDVEPDPELQVEISKVFGPLKDHPVPSVPRANGALHPGVVEIGQAPREGNIVMVDGKEVTSWLPWHFDHCYNNELNYAGVLRCVTGVSEGGQTGFADGIELYQALSPALRQQIEDRNVLYSLNLRFRDMRFGLTDGFREVQPHLRLQETIDFGKKNLPRAVHPAVWTRRSGEKVLHISPWMAEGLEGDETADGDQLLEAVCKAMLAAIKPYFHTWRPTDMVIWDNLRMLHAVTGHDPNEARYMHRTTIKGDYGLGYFEGNVQGDRILEMTV